MANREKGEVSVVVDGVTYTLVLNLAAMIAAEEQSEAQGKPLTWDALMAQAVAGSARATRLFLWAMFQKHHADLSLGDVTAVIDAAGGVEGFRRAMDAAQQALTPAREDVEALGPPSRPRKARVNGSGGRSTSPVAARA